MEISRAIEIQKSFLEMAESFLADDTHKMSEDLRKDWEDDAECSRLSIKALEQMQEREKAKDLIDDAECSRICIKVLEQMQEREKAKDLIDDEIIENLVTDIQALARKVSQTTKHDVFTRYSGHINALWIQIHINGWQENDTTANDGDMLYLDSIAEFEDNEKWLKMSIKKLEGIKQELLNLV